MSSWLRTNELESRCECPTCQCLFYNKVYILSLTLHKFSNDCGDIEIICTFVNKLDSGAKFVKSFGGLSVLTCQSQTQTMTRPLVDWVVMSEQETVLSKSESSCRANTLQGFASGGYTHSLSD